MNPFRHPLVQDWKFNVALAAAFVAGASLFDRFGPIWGAVYSVIGVCAGIGLYVLIVAIRRRRPPF